MQTYHYELDLDSVNSNSLIARQIVKGSRVLEFGPAYGRLTKYMQKELSCTVDLVELDAKAGSHAMAYARTACLGNPDGDIETYRWESILDARTYDFIIFADVLEHLRSPQSVLSACRQYLNEHGVILCSVPNIAHSSVILSLWNDDFTYQGTGLLDRTHVHFFTKKTFCDMADTCGYAITDIQEIVSAVGQNEIPYTYDTVPAAVESGLRFRMEGEVYQYLFRLQKKEACGAKTAKTVNYGSQSGYSCICYIRQKKDTDFRKGKSIEKRYTDRLADIYFDLRTFSDIDGLCIKLIEKSAFIKIISIEPDSVSRQIETNGQAVGDGWYVFADEAMIYLKAPEDAPSVLHLQYEVTVTEKELAHEMAGICRRQEEKLRRMREQYCQDLNRKEENILEELLGDIVSSDSK